MPEIVKDGVSGYICRSVREMSKRALGLDLNPAMVRRYVEDNFSIEKMVKRYIALYDETLTKKGAVCRAPLVCSLRYMAKQGKGARSLSQKANRRITSEIIQLLYRNPSILFPIPSVMGKSPYSPIEAAYFQTWSMG